MVSLLLQHGADANAINNDGRSALMEAALWGRIESVKALLKAQADKRLRDQIGLLAIDLAQPARKNEKERYRRSSNAAAERSPSVIETGDILSFYSVTWTPRNSIDTPDRFRRVNRTNTASENPNLKCQ